MNAGLAIFTVMAVLIALSLIPCLIRDHRRAAKASEDLKRPLNRHPLAVMDPTELLIRSARAIDLLRTSADFDHAADEGQAPPGVAARHAWDAASVLRTAGEAFIDLSEQRTFAARRYEAEQRREDMTGTEYKGPTAA